MKKRKDGRWQKTKTINGRAVTFYSSAKTERAALMDILNQMLKYQQKVEEGKTFRSVAEKWKEEELRRVQETTWKKYHDSKFKNVCEYFADTYIDEITLNDIERFLKTKYIYSKSTVSAYKSVLNMIFDYAVINGYLDCNNIRVIRLPDNLNYTLRENASDEDIAIVNKNYDGDGLLYYMCLWTGLRPSELIALRDSDFDFENSVIYVNNTIVHDGNTPIFRQSTKTRAGKRIVPLLDKVKKVLPKDFKGFLFCNEDGTPFTKKKLECMKRRYKKQTGIKSTLYQFRHSYATMLIELGLDEKMIETFMGHTTVQMTLKGYARTRKKKIDEAKEKIDKFEF